MVKENPITQLLLAVVIFVLGLSMGGMFVRIQVLEEKLKGGGNTAAAVNNQPTQNVPTEPPSPTSVEVQVKPEDPSKGPADAKLTVVEFSDFQCPFCQRFFEQVESNLIKDYVNTGKVKFVYKQLAILGKESADAANASLCAKEQNKFWEYHDFLFTNQSGENQGAFAVDNLKKFAADLGLNTTQFNSCLDAAKYNAQVQADIAEATRVGFNSTPSTAVGTIPIIGAQPYQQFKDAIERELAK